MEKHKLKDFIDATKEEAGNVAVKEVLPAVVKEVGGYGKNIFLIFSSIILGIGHIGIHLNHRKEVQ